MTNTLMNAYAGGTIYTARFVKANTSHANSAIQCDDGDELPLGISQNAGRLNPDPNYSADDVLKAAVSGESVGIHPPGSVSVDLACAYAWAPGDLLMPDADGKGVLATTGKYYGARAEGTGVVGALCPVTVVCGLRP